MSSTYAADSADEHFFKLGAIADDVAHQKHVGMKNFCSGCGWPKGYCVCPATIEFLKAELARRLDSSLDGGTLTP